MKAFVAALIAFFAVVAVVAAAQAPVPATAPRETLKGAEQFYYAAPYAAYAYPYAYPYAAYGYYYR